MSPTPLKPYVIYRTPAGNTPPASALSDWRNEAWAAAPELVLRNFHPNSSGHRPFTAVRVMYDAGHLYVCFRVVDRYVRAVHFGYQVPVCKDSCVEFFVQPGRGPGYFNFEVNCGGSLLLYYIEDPRRFGLGFAQYTPVPLELGGTVTVRTSLARRVEPELTYGVEWFATLGIPLALLEHFAGPLGDPSGQTWRGNFYKCADETSHPHWGSWMPMGQGLNFHRPEIFGLLQFADAEGKVEAPPPEDAAADPMTSLAAEAIRRFAEE